MHKYTQAEFIHAWEASGGSPQVVSELLGTTIRGVYQRRVNLAKQGIILETTPIKRGGQTLWTKISDEQPVRTEVGIKDGHIIIFSDAHYWPGEASISHRALLNVTSMLKPAVVVANGDILDGARISKHDKSSWAPRPKVPDEFTVATQRLSEIEEVAGFECRFYWNLGNHDIRFEKYIAIHAPELEGLKGTTLPEHFPRWSFQMSLMLNPKTDSAVMIKHRFSGGIHAGYNNTLRAGLTMVTGHLHRLLVTPWGDYNGRRWGVDTGTLADPNGPQFRYREDDPSSGAQGFAVLTFRDGVLLPPELCEVINGRAAFRGNWVS